MICRGCKNDHAFRVRIGYDPVLKISSECCDKCGTVGQIGIPDVYWPGHPYYSENITDRMGKPILLESRQHKMRVMRQQNMSEMGDRYHGSRDGAYKYAIKQK